MAIGNAASLLLLVTVIAAVHVSCASALNLFHFPGLQRGPHDRKFLLKQPGPKHTERILAQNFYSAWNANANDHTDYGPITTHPPVDHDYPPPPFANANDHTDYGPITTHPPVDHDYPPPPFWNVGSAHEDYAHVDPNPPSNDYPTPGYVDPNPPIHDSLPLARDVVLEVAERSCGLTCDPNPPTHSYPTPGHVDPNPPAHKYPPPAWSVDPNPPIHDYPPPPVM